MKRNMKRKGFTLVELLIVIVVIGILSAMMMLSSTEAVTSAKASNIVSNLRNLKTAALSLYVDSLDKWKDSTTYTDLTSNKTQLIKYLNNGNENVADYANYSIEVAIDSNNNGLTIAEKNWYLKYDLSGDDSRIKSKLAGRAKSIGLLSDTNGTQYAGGATDNTVYYKVR